MLAGLVKLSDRTPQECFVYGLVDPRDQAIRYIGQTSRGLERPRSHWLGSSSYAVNVWVDELKALGLEFEIVVLEYVPKPELRDAEARQIQKAADVGAPLLNRQLYANRAEKTTHAPVVRTMPTRKGRFGRTTWDEAVRSRNDPEFARTLEPKPKPTLVERMQRLIAERKDR